MTRLEFVTEYSTLVQRPMQYGVLNYRPVEHVVLEGNGLEDFHASDRVRLSLETGYWGTLDLG